jgi:hypothetical protein
LKNDLKMKFEKKEKKKKQKPAPDPFGPGGPAQLPAPAHRSPLLFFFFTAAPTDGSHLSASPFPPSFLLPRARRLPPHAALNPPCSRLLPFLSLLCEHAN